ncbi:MAG: hypothetical protein Q8R00_00700 [Candidatus Nanoarchaeia archaeon]|nr:hypothetical protein [Candidatus Nanoarchaeia archaeon]
MENFEKIQNGKLKLLLKEIPNHPYYKQLFLKNNIKLSSINTVKDLAKIPFTTKEDLVKQPERFVLNGKGDKYKPIHVHFTAGRTSRPVPFYYTKMDIETMKEVGKRLFSLVKASKNEIAVNSFPYAPHLAFWQTYYALNACGIMSLHSGGGKILGTDKIIQSIKGMNASVLLGMPGYVYHLLRTANENGVKLDSLKMLVLGGEKISDGLRNKLKTFVDAKVYSTYGFTEGKTVWGQCHEDSGYHLYPDLEYVEEVDGEIVYSALDWKGSIVLRYKTGDLAKLETDKCKYCGSENPRISRDIGRKSEVREINLVKVKGTFINLNFVKEIVDGVKGVREWQIELKKKNDDPYEIDEIYLYVVPVKKGDFARLKEELKKTMAQTEISFTDIIEVSLPDMVKRLGIETELKERRILDIR